MKCGRCDPDGYCGCRDFFDGLRALGRGEYDHLLPPGGTRKGPTEMSKPIPAIAAVDMPFGTYVEVDANGFARPDPTYECRGGVVRRPGGSNNSCREGDSIKVETEGHIQMLNPHGLNVAINLESGRIQGGPAAVPGLKR